MKEQFTMIRPVSPAVEMRAKELLHNITDQTVGLEPQECFDLLHVVREMVEANLNERINQTDEDVDILTTDTPEQLIKYAEGLC